MAKQTSVNIDQPSPDLLQSLRTVLLRISTAEKDNSEFLVRADCGLPSISENETIFLVLRLQVASG
jgi:hypothetical protein